MRTSLAFTILCGVSDERLPALRSAAIDLCWTTERDSFQEMLYLVGAFAAGMAPLLALDLVLATGAYADEDGNNAFDIEHLAAILRALQPLKPRRLELEQFFEIDTAGWEGPRTAAAHDLRALLSTITSLVIDGSVPEEASFDQLLTALPTLVSLQIPEEHAPIFGRLPRHLRDITIVYGFESEVLHSTNIDVERTQLAHLVDVRRFTIRYERGDHDGWEVHMSPPNIEELIIDWDELSLPCSLTKVCSALEDRNWLSSLRRLTLYPSSSLGYSTAHYDEDGGRVLRWDALEELKTICNSRGVTLDVEVGYQAIY
jgi:hypothetical protein